MSTPEDDVVARARAIFERLRQGGIDGGSTSATESPETPATADAPAAEEPVTDIIDANALVTGIFVSGEDVVEQPTGDVTGLEAAEADNPSGTDAPPPEADATGDAGPAVDADARAEATSAADTGTDTPEPVGEAAPLPLPLPLPAPAPESDAEPEPAAAGADPPHPHAAPAPAAAATSLAPAGAPIRTPDARRGSSGPDGGPSAPPAPGLEAPAAPLEPAARLPLPRVLAIANQKGGVGKTTTAVNLGAALAELGYRVLVVDLDPQGNATTGLGVNPRNLETSIYDVIMHDTPLEDAVEATAVRNLFVVPATIDLAGAEIELVPAFSRELKLRKAIEAGGEDFDFTLIDCPPSLGLLTVNGLAAAHEVVVPIQCEYYALEGLGQLLRNVALVQNNLNPGLDVTTIILTMYDARTKLADQVAQEVRKHFGAKVCRNIVPRTVRLSEAPSFGQPIIIFDPSSRGAIAYRELAKEVSGGAPQRVG